MRSLIPLCSLCLLAMTIVACDDAEPQSTGPDAGPAADVGPQPDAIVDAAGPDAAGPDAAGPDAAADAAPPATCEAGAFDRTGFSVAEATLTPQMGAVIYSAQSAPGTPHDAFVIQIYEGYDNSPDGPGRYPLDGVNFRDCGICLLAWSGCNSEGECDAMFYAQQGTVELTATPDSGRLAARLENVVFEETEIDWEGDYTSTPVAGGASWCIDGLEVDESVEQRPSRCDPALNDGCAQIGETISGVSLTQCGDDGPAPLDEIGDDPKAIVMFLTAGWCPACSAMMPEMARLAAERADAGLEVVYVVGEDPSYRPSTTEYCQAYAGRYPDARPDRFFRDHDGDQDFAAFFGRVWRYPTPRGTFGMPWIGVIDGRDMRYVWSNAAMDGRTLDDVLDEVLARP